MFGPPSENTNIVASFFDPATDADHRTVFIAANDINAKIFKVNFDEHGKLVPPKTPQKTRLKEVSTRS